MTNQISSDPFKQDANEEHKLPPINDEFEPKIVSAYTLRSNGELSADIEFLRVYYSNMFAVPSFADIVKTLVTKHIEELEKSGEPERFEEVKKIIDSIKK